MSVLYTKCHPLKIIPGSMPGWCWRSKTRKSSKCCIFLRQRFPEFHILTNTSRKAFKLGPGLAFIQ